MRAAAVEEHVLPLRDHAEVAVVDEHDDDREIVDHRRRQLLSRHLEAAVAVDAHDCRFGPGSLRSDGRRDPVPHRPEPPEVMKFRGRSMRRYCIAHIWCWPTPVVKMTSSPAVSSCSVSISFCGFSQSPPEP